jgi:branched-chain amino acid transport system substrate-binding protein
MAFEATDWKIGDYSVQPVWIDSQSDPQKAATAYQEAVIRDGIDAGLLNWHSSVAVAVMEVTARYKVPHFFGMAATEVVNEKYHSNPARYGYWMAKAWPTPAKLSVAYLEALEDAVASGRWRPQNRKAAIWGEDTDWGRSFGQAMRRQLQARGWTIETEEYFPLGETDFYPLLLKFKDRRVSLLAGSSTAPPALAAFIKQASEVRPGALMIADGLGWAGEWYTLTGSASDDVLDQIPAWMTSAALEFAAEFERRWHISPSPAAAGLSYDAANFFIAIARRALQVHGKLNRESLFRVGRDDVMTGRMTFTEGIVMAEYEYTAESAPDPVVGMGKYLFPVRQYRAGIGRVVWPEAWRETELHPPGRLLGFRERPVSSAP